MLLKHGPRAVLSLEQGLSILFSFRNASGPFLDVLSCIGLRYVNVLQCNCVN